MAKPSPIFKRFWVAYGGSGALLRSPYLYVALLIAPLCWGTWSAPNWWDTVISVLPNLLGFTLGGFAIFVSFGDARFIASLAAEEENAVRPTVYRELCATFVHFILVQVAALVLAIVTKGMWFQANLPDYIASALPIANLAWGAFCYAVFLYALTSIVAIALHVFRISTMYELYQRMAAPDEPGCSCRIEQEATKS
ncbi:hypothetical protein M2165_003234 [Variovorax sp. TBS-050B]|uniref:hypothetical protein n=1 Tax=Variovorax sp. TBS-050B TaxID=2940551 RepID=UPI002476642F|nr:hypothetical protein [Variovorax sp. TBS-050B]MDH6593345.1 hypothetical protein [Variovorax sp. TBS-050B]